jgi:protein transport protein DSL1/ZW10
VQNDIRRLSRESAPNVDGWISQAKQLHADITRSRETARKIVQDHEHGKVLHSNVRDASGKVNLLQSEIRFNEDLVQTLSEIQDLDGKFSNVKESLAQDRFVEAISRLDEVDASINNLGSLRRSRVVEILQKRASDMRSYIVEDVQRVWSSLIRVDRAKRFVRINSSDGAPSTLVNSLIAIVLI